MRRTRRWLRVLAVGLLGPTGGCGTGPSLSEADATSCRTTGILGEGGRDFRDIDPPGGTVLVGRTMTLSVCFYRDLERPAERAAISWSVLDPRIARVTPMTGPAVTVTGLAFGRRKYGP